MGREKHIDGTAADRRMFNPARMVVVPSLATAEVAGTVAAMISHGKEGHVPSQSEMLSEQEMEKLLRERAVWRTMRDVYKEGCYCIDGRSKKGAVVGVPGGNAGVFVAVAHAAELLSGKKLSKGQIAVFVHSFPGTLYAHTDDHDPAHTILSHDLLQPFIPRNVPAAVQEQHVFDLLRKGENGMGAPSGSAGNALRGIAVNPALVGCGHMKKMYEYGASYGGVRKQLIEDVMEVMVGLAWDSEDDRVIYDVLQGPHNERAAAVVMNDAEDDLQYDDTPVLFLQPWNGNQKDSQFFVVHPAVGRALIAKCAPCLKQVFPDLREDQLIERADGILTAQTVETARRLAKGKPRYNIHTNAREKSYSVETGEPF